MKQNPRLKVIAVSLLIFLSAFTLAADPEPIVCSEVVKGSLKDVWSAFTTGPGQASWMVFHSEVDLRVGGLMRTHYSKDGKIGDKGTIENLILSFDPERMFSIKIAKAPESFPWKKAAESTWTVVYFEPVSDKETKVTVRMMGWKDDEESKTMRKFFDAGNKQTLDALKRYFEKKQSGRSLGG